MSSLAIIEFIFVSGCALDSSNNCRSLGLGTFPIPFIFFINPICAMYIGDS